ncbi:MAG: hypothetical protein OQK73_05830 [Gammaproteobacteria bacterium]|nr:hypothetical protein [Gammaproteobacteria bacterium]
MLKNFSFLAIIFAILSSPTVVAETEKSAEEQCKQFAQEEQISAEEMKDYIAECVASLTEAKSQDDR